MQAGRVKLDQQSQAIWDVHKRMEQEYKAGTAAAAGKLAAEYDRLTRARRVYEGKVLNMENKAGQFCLKKRYPSHVGTCEVVSTTSLICVVICVIFGLRSIHSK